MAPSARPVAGFMIDLLLSAHLFTGAITPSAGGQPRQARQNRLSQSDHLEFIRKSKPSFRNKTLVVGIIVREPFVIFNKPLDWNVLPPRDQQLAREDLDNYGGVAIELVKRLKTIFEFGTKLTSPADGQFGILSPENGTWNGLMGQLVRAEVDIGVTALSLTMTRAQFADFSRAYYVETAAILIRTPEEIQNYLAIFEPFSFTVWLVLFATILTLIFLISFMTRLEDSQRRQEKMHKLMKFLRTSSIQSGDGGASLATRLNEPRFSVQFQHKLDGLVRVKQAHEYGSSWLERFYYAVTCVINILLIRDIKNPPRQTPIRILVCIWWLSTIVIVNIYLGILFGQLVVPRRPKSIETLEELVNQDQVNWAVTRGSAIYELFRQSGENSVYGQLGRRMKLVSTADEGVERVLNSNWAFIRERSILTFKVAQEHNRLKACRMQFAREQFYSVGFALGLVKNSSYTKPFNSALTLMIENGLVSHFQSMYWPKKNEFTECSLKATEGAPLTIKHFISIYLVCSIIICTSMCILIHQRLHEQFKISVNKLKTSTKQLDPSLG